MSSKAKGLLWIGATAALAALLVLFLELVAHTFPWKWEGWLGHELSFDSALKECRDSGPGDAALAKLWGRLFPLEPGDTDIPAHLEVVREPTVNAYASLGGRIYLQSGLLEAAESPEEVAGVLAHELEHVKRRHVLDGVGFRLFPLLLESGGASQAAEFFLRLKFSRTQEAEADRGGLERLRRAHISSQGFRDFFLRLAHSASVPSLVSDHPGSAERAELAEQIKTSEPKPVLSEKEWESLRKICD